MNAEHIDNSPVIVAHIDTVAKHPPTILYRTADTISTKDEILGADDRAGVYAALILAEKHHIPALFCDLEEHGGIGARESIVKFGETLKKALFFIELDRAHKKDAVFYNDEPKKFRKMITRHGFTRAFGSFSDISIICRKLQICGVNLSIGYEHQHSTKETLDLSIMYKTIRKTSQIIEHSTKHPKQYRLPKRREYTGWSYEEYMAALCPAKIQIAPAPRRFYGTNYTRIDREHRDIDDLDWIDTPELDDADADNDNTAAANRTILDDLQQELDLDRIHTIDDLDTYESLLTEYAANGDIPNKDFAQELDRIALKRIEIQHGDAI